MHIEFVIPMKILILGNIGAGKTSLAKKLHKKYSFQFLSIDDCRKKYGDGTVPGEYLAHYHFLHACVNDSNVILEFTGAGCHKYAIKKALEDSNSEILVIFLDVSNTLCKQRISDRDWDIPIPSWKFDLDKHLEFVAADLASDSHSGFWTTSKRFYAAKYENKQESDLEWIFKEVNGLIEKLKVKGG